MSSPAGPVFAPPAGAWVGPLSVAFTDPAVASLLPSGLGAPSLTSPESLRSAAPLVQSLAQALSVTPEAFAAMTPADRKGAVELAAEDAKEAVRAKAYELSETARALSKPGRAMDKEGRAELYAAVSKLMEMREHYGPWLDDGGKALIQQVYQLAKNPEFGGRIAFIEDYDMHVARYLVQGVDMWLNNPLAPLEACGTSGEKAGANGVPDFSVLDGWWDEGYDGSNGFAVKPVDPKYWSSLVDDHEARQRRDEEEGRQLLDIIEHQVVPLYYGPDNQGYVTHPRSYRISGLPESVRSRGAHIFQPCYRLIVQL